MGPRSTGRLSGVLLYRMGQTNAKARYPFHMHAIGDAFKRQPGMGDPLVVLPAAAALRARTNESASSYVTDSAIWRSYFRAVSIHATNSSRVLRNVAYDVIGHAYYLEDGVEEGNLLQHNLGVHVHPVGYPPTDSNRCMMGRASPQLAAWTRAPGRGQ